MESRLVLAFRKHALKCHYAYIYPQLTIEVGTPEENKYDLAIDLHRKQGRIQGWRIQCASAGEAMRGEKSLVNCIKVKSISSDHLTVTVYR